MGLQELADEKLVDLQIKVQCASQGEAEIQVILKQLHDLQTSMCKTNQQKEEVNLHTSSITSTQSYASNKAESHQPSKLDLYK